jgi:hypothetical protein
MIAVVIAVVIGLATVRVALGGAVRMAILVSVPIGVRGAGVRVAGQRLDQGADVGRPRHQRQSDEHRQHRRPPM